ncbi:MAG: VOC family protein [Cytophagales bacterium]|nr:VOC family protein [Cytophaga sp.]
MKIPAQYLPLMPYLILKDSKGFHAFAQTVFHVTDQMVVPGENGNIMHGELKVFDAVIMSAQANANWTEKSAGMCVYVEGVDAINANTFAAGAKSLMSLEKNDYGYTAGFEDPFGNQ